MNPEQLRDAFEAQAGQVQFGPDPLGAIRARIDHRSRRQLRVRLVSFGGAVVATVAAVVIGVVSCQPVPRPQPVPPIGSTGPTSPAPGPSPTVPPAVGVTVPVYWVGQQAGRSVLYREFRSATVRADTLNERIAAAVGLALSGPPLDPDYATPWPAGASVRAVSVDNGVSTVDVSANPPDAIAVQQLVWTVTAVAADRGTALSGVRLTVNGSPQGGLLTRADATATQAALWLLSPQQGETVHSPFTVQLDGSVFEAAARLRVRDAAGKVVSDQAVLLSIGAPQRGQTSVMLTLAPGHYTIEAYVVSVRDGAEIDLDGHDITVE
jgi:Immunoglobulin-like domain of bacterial spore germination/Sporulation and spore germination